VTDADSQQMLRLRLTDVPGWHASIGWSARSRSRRFAGVMLQIELPPGRHTVVLRYWPAAFTVGIILAAGAVVGLLVAFAVGLTAAAGDDRPLCPT